MPKELYYIRFLQAVISINTLVFANSILQIRNGNISLHRKLNLSALTTTGVGIIGLVLTLCLGWDYQVLTTPDRILVHRSFSSPLAIALPIAAYYGWKAKRKPHFIAVCFVIPLWIGTLITGIWFF